MKLAMSIVMVAVLVGCWQSPVDPAYTASFEVVDSVQGIDVDSQPYIDLTIQNIGMGDGLDVGIRAYVSVDEDGDLKTVGSREIDFDDRVSAGGTSTARIAFLNQNWDWTDVSNTFYSIRWINETERVKEVWP